MSDTLDGPRAAVPFRQFVLKVHSRCNLSCDYCYVYELADQGWRSQPLVMSPAVMARTAERIADHSRRHGLRDVWVVLHGGEPLLAGVNRLSSVVKALRTEVPARVHVSVQTNGTLLDDAFLALFEDLGVTVGVSLDGDAGATSRHRRDRNGNSSHQRVVDALERLRSDRWRSLYGGLLCTIDIRNEPIQTYEALLEHEPPTIDLLLPHATWTTPPPRTAASSATPYGDWLVAVFDRWYEAPVRETGIRLFEEILSLVLGGRSRSEAIGLSPIDILVVETDGRLEQADSLKVAYDGAAATGLNVAEHALDAALGHPGILARQRGIDGLAASCRSCPVVTVCGGGMYAHRYRADTGFDNPSVYCADLRTVIDHIVGRVRTDLQALPAGV